MVIVVAPDGFQVPIEPLHSLIEPKPVLRMAFEECSGGLAFKSDNWLVWMEYTSISTIII